jgi:hypothetical protein
VLYDSHRLPAVEPPDRAGEVFDFVSGPDFVRTLSFLFLPEVPVQGEPRADPDRFPGKAGGDQGMVGENAGQRGQVVVRKSRRDPGNSGADRIHDAVRLVPPYLPLLLSRQGPDSGSPVLDPGRHGMRPDRSVRTVPGQLDGSISVIDSHVERERFVFFRRSGKGCFRHDLLLIQ